jgi:ElaA protein
LRWVRKSFDELTTRELYDLLRLRTDVFVVEQSCAYPEMDGKDPLCTHLLAYEDSQLAAYARWYPDGEQVVLGRIVTRGDLRKRGLNRRLMARVLDAVGARPIRISAQRYLEQYYQSLGFETVSDPYDDFGISHVDMVRQHGERSLGRSV